jgi:hypothetical protein
VEFPGDLQHRVRLGRDVFIIQQDNRGQISVFRSEQHEDLPSTFRLERSEPEDISMIPLDHKLHESVAQVAYTVEEDDGMRR